jgi:hypothetical protein
MRCIVCKRPIENLEGNKRIKYCPECRKIVLNLQKKRWANQHPNKVRESKRKYLAKNKKIDDNQTRLEI